ncbi:MAG TPA: hypothetical protein VH079_02840 [Terriglobales bacterium]|nr:hypothetical protein [Terriglobales bacterium]
MLADANGNRYTPSFTVKKNRKYRYYVSQLAIKNPDLKFTGPLRLPAREIENLVTERLASFLRSDGEVFDRLGGSTDRPGDLRQLVAAAKNFVEGWPSVRSNEFKDLLQCFVRRVIIHEDDVQVLISRASLQQVLEKGDTFVPHYVLNAPDKSGHPDDLICDSRKMERI